MKEPTKEIYDRVNISFPETMAQHRICMGSGLALHPINNLAFPEEAMKFPAPFHSPSYEVHSTVPRALTMSFIRAYLRKHCLDKDFG
jgi:hypothetical protein